ncbi:MAG: cyclic pyranopterin monophosphate synthase MoaC [Chromatiales bacterium]|nr:cyclic pyranopterin monophosphate synthase MoaC [Chromatiales bacterium]
MSELTHFDKQGNAQMVNISDKAVTRRVAIAEGCILLNEKTLQAILSGKSAKGDVLGVARLAGIMAAKRTSELIPLCHSISLSSIEVNFETQSKPPAVVCRSRAEIDAKTGIEMEAITAVQIALLTVYDMCKAMDRGMVIDNIRLIEKSGGRSGTWHRPENSSV